ncbi:MAG: hypothetical protein QXW48_01455 [Thermoplasmata archaeon]
MYKQFYVGRIFTEAELIDGKLELCVYNEKTCEEFYFESYDPNLIKYFILEDFTAVLFHFIPQDLFDGVWHFIYKNISFSVYSTPNYTFIHAKNLKNNSVRFIEISSYKLHREVLKQNKEFIFKLLVQDVVLDIYLSHYKNIKSLHPNLPEIKFNHIFFTSLIPKFTCSSSRRFVSNILKYSPKQVVEKIKNYSLKSTNILKLL